MEKLSNIEQASGSKIIFLYTESGRVILVEQNKLEAFIEDNQMNYELVVTGNNSPTGDGDPSFDTEELEMISEPAEYLDDNFESVCQSYLNTVLISHNLKSVA